MSVSGGRDLRDRPRHVVTKVIDVNGGAPNRGGTLRDISLSGAAIVYPENFSPVDAPIELNEMIRLNIQGRDKFLGKIVRIYDGGFAVCFDWAHDMETF